MTKMFPVIDPVATGENIVRLRKMRGLTVRDLQKWFGFEEPQAIYTWQKGKTLPSIDNLYALGALLEVPMEEILVPCRPQLNIAPTGQQAEACCLILLKSRGVLAHTLELPGRDFVPPMARGESCAFPPSRFPLKSRGVLAHTLELPGGELAA